MRTAARLRLAWMIGVGVCSLALPAGVLVVDPLAAAPPKNSRQKAKPADPAPDQAAEADIEEPNDPAAEKRAMVRLNYVEATWEKVLKDVAKATNTSLVADYIPKGKFSRFDFKRYTKAEALKILNHELAPMNFRLQFKGSLLELRHLRERQEYPAAVLGGDKRSPESDKAVANDTDTPAADRRKQVSSTASRTEGKQAKPARAASRGNKIQLASAEEDSDARFERGAVRESQPALVEPPIETTVPLRAHKAGTIAGRVYRAFGTQAEKTEDGPQGLRGFHVRRLPTSKRAADVADQPPVQFSVGIDSNRNELIVAAPQADTKPIVKLLKALDNVPKTADGAGLTRIVKTKKDAGKLAKALQPELDRLAQETRRSTRSGAQSDDADADMQETDEDMPGRRPGGRNANRDRAEEDEQAAGDRSLFGSLKGDVLVESIPELGILVIRGNEADVQAVEKVIEEIERLSVQTAPRVKLAILRHISSEALASLLTSVYERLAGARNSAVQQSQAISVFPVSRPNAVLIVASNADINAVFALIDELDRPSGPSTEFMVYRLKYAIPSKVVDQVEALYPAPTQQQAAAGAQGQNNAVGLVPRVRIIEDLRTNSVIVQARPRDLKEVAKLIEDLDKNDSDSRQQINIFPLTNAVADEVAFTLSSSIQKVLDPARATTAPTTGQPGQQGGAFAQQQQGGGASQGSSELREVKSTILEFLDVDGPEGRKLRSGILSDIRMVADLRTNSIVVTAPPESMEFVARLISKLDRPSATIAEIKVFKLINADATSVQTLLERLFGIQRTGQQGGQGGGAQQQGVPGLLVADAEDSSSMLIPLRFSVDVRTNSIIAIGGGGALGVVEAVVLKLDESDIRQRKNEVYFLKNAPATNVSTAIGSFLQTQQQILTADPGIISPFEQIEREVIVVAEATTNSLLISATPRFFDDIKNLIVQLDRTPRQVLIQGLIVEVTLNNVDEFGMELGLQDSILFSRSAIPAPVTINRTVTQPNGNSVTNQQIISESGTPGYLFGPAAGGPQQLGNNTFSGDSLSPGASDPKNVAGQAVTGFATALTNGQLGYGGLVLQAGSENINFLLRALAVRTRVDILSRPQIRTVDNQYSQIQVGQEIPRVNGFQSNGTAGVIVPTIEQRAIGIILIVTPRITPDGLVIMEVVARKDSLDAKSISLGISAAGTSITSPIVNTTNAQTTIAVNSGQTVILGGMITKQDNVEERKVPILGDIPILGRAFRYDLKQTLRTELLIFLTPRVISDDDEAEMFKQIEIERLNFIESEAERMHGPLRGNSADYCPPTGPGSSTAPQRPTTAPAGPSLSPSSPANNKTILPPPDAGIPGRPTTKRSPEPRPLPAADADDGETEASLLRNDDEDLDEPFVQADYQPKQTKAAAAGRSRTAKPGDRKPAIQKASDPEPDKAMDKANKETEDPPPKKKQSRWRSQ